MYVVYKMKYYAADDPKVEIKGICRDKKVAKRLAKEINGEYLEVPLY